MSDGKAFVAAVQVATAAHKAAWEALVPNREIVDRAHEAAEEDAWQAMAAAKLALRRHISETYGVTAAELCTLATI